MVKMSMDNITSLIIVFEDHGKLELPRKKTNNFSEQAEVFRKPEK
jgi:hypothetical protein